MPHQNCTNVVDAIPAEDLQRSVEELRDRYDPEGWGEHPVFTRDEWRNAVANDETLAGYWDWVVYMLSLVAEGDLV